MRAVKRQAVLRVLDLDNLRTGKAPLQHLAGQCEDDERPTRTGLGLRKAEPAVPLVIPQQLGASRDEDGHLLGLL